MTAPEPPMPAADGMSRRRPTMPTRRAPCCSASPTCGPGCSWPSLILGFEVWARVSFGGTFLFNPFNLQSIAVFAVAPLLLATGQTFVIISGGIDLSLGFIMGLAAVVAAHVINWADARHGHADGGAARRAGGRCWWRRFRAWSTACWSPA